VQLLRLRAGQIAVQEQGLGPGDQVDAGQGELQPGLVDREDPGREPAEAGGFAAADAVFDAGVGAGGKMRIVEATLIRLQGVAAARPP
jgi:hypothetical protein